MSNEKIFRIAGAVLLIIGALVSLWEGYIDMKFSSYRVTRADDPVGFWVLIVTFVLFGILLIQ